MNLIKSLEKSRSFWFLVFASFLFFLLRLPSLFEPYWYSDEGIYQAVGMLLRAGHPLYSGAWENKTPLLLYLYAFFNSDQYIIRAVSLLFGLFSTWFFYYVAKHLFGGVSKIAALSTLIFVFLFATPIVEGNIANAENFMLLPILAGAYLLTTHHLSENKQKKMLFTAGVLLSLAFLTKIVAVFDFAAFGFYLLITSEKQIQQTLKLKIYPYLLGFIIPFLITVFYFLVTKNIKDFLNALLLQNVGYVAQNNGLLIPQGLLILKLLILLSVLFFIYIKRANLSKTFIFITVWFAFGLFNAFFSQRPYDHYLLMVISSFSLMVGFIISQSKWTNFAFVLFIVPLIFILHSFNPHWNLYGYYKNSIMYSVGKENASAYQSFFDPNLPRDYELANYIKTNISSEDSIYIWGNNPQLYKLSGKTPITRYVAAYHSTYFPTGIDETKKAIENKKPKLIIVIPNTSPFPASLMNYQEKINISGAIVYEKIY